MGNISEVPKSSSLARRVGDEGSLDEFFRKALAALESAGYNSATARARFKRKSGRLKRSQACGKLTIRR